MRRSVELISKTESRRAVGDLYPSTVVVQRFAIGSGLSLNAATLVAVGFVPAVRGKHLSCLLPLDIHLTTIGCVQCHLVPRRCSVIRFEDINLPVRGPVVWIGKPERWPGATAVGRVQDVKDEQTAIVGVLRRDPD